MRFLQRFIVLVSVLLLVSIGAYAQGTTGYLTGTVTTDGNALPGATVTISSPQLQGTRTAVTDVNGNYNFGALPPGEYTVKVELSGMSTVTRTARVSLAGTARVDADLKLSAVAEAITVTASSPTTAALETTEVETNVPAQLVENLPMARNIQSTANLAPGVTTNGFSANQLVISGAPGYDNLYLVNGAVVNENLRSQIHNLFIEDAIQETTVLTGGISAEYGRFTGGVVSTITKSGGNEFHGSLRDSFTNPRWTSQSDFGEPKPKSVLQETYEATLGGRIIRDRLWFFTAGRYYSLSTPQVYYRDPNHLLGTYNFGDEERRLEGKLTGQITPKHSLTGSYMDITRTNKNNCFGSCWEPSNLDVERQLPNNFLVLHYNGILTSNLLLEAGFSKKYFAFVGSGGDFTDFAHGTPIATFFATGGGYLGAPVFCGVCDKETRNNKDELLKGTYYLATKGLGTHNLVVGAESFENERKANNHQSGSDFFFYTFNVPQRAANGTVEPIISEGDFFLWNPILENSKGSKFQTDSLFANDKWDFNNHFSFNLGVRYDKNNGKDASDNTISKDSNISPRLGAIYDVFGNNRLRINASYSKYVSQIAEGVGGNGAAGGNPAYIYYYYLGPTISGVPTVDALQQAYDWFQAQGGLRATDLIFGGGVPGVTVKVTDQLKSPSTDEYSFGVGGQIGARGFIRGDYIYRKWDNFYAQMTNASNFGPIDQVLPIPGATTPVTVPADFGLVVNTDALQRDYRSLQFQGSYRLFNRVDLGGNYTYSKLKGNTVGETSGSGPIADPILQYPEYKAFAQYNPVGYLPSDQRHKGRAWVSFDMPTPVGKFNFSVLERYDSGLPYSINGQISTGNFVSAYGVHDPGYVGAPTRVGYYFSKRGQFRWDNLTSTDLAVNYALPISKLEVFVQGELRNALNEQAQTGGDTTILTARNSSCKQTANPTLRCAAFNPFTTTPVEGVNWQKASTFGTARSNNDFQLPRTFLVSAGLRF